MHLCTLLIGPDAKFNASLDCFCPSLDPDYGTAFLWMGSPPLSYAPALLAPIDAWTHHARYAAHYPYLLIAHTRAGA